MNHKPVRKSKSTQEGGTKKTKVSITKAVLISKINHLYKESLISGKESMKCFIMVGLTAIKLKKQVGHGNFNKTIETKLLCIDLRQVQRAMRLAKAYDFSNHEALYLAPREHLERIIKNAAKTDVMDFLAKNNVNLDIDHEEKKELQDFLEAIKNIANRSSESTKKDHKSSDDEVDGDNEDEPPPSNNTKEINFRTIRRWFKNVRKEKEEAEQMLSKNQTVLLQKLIDELQELFDDLGTQEDDEDEDDDNA